MIWPVAIVGAGAAGSALALGLGGEVALLDDGRPRPGAAESLPPGLRTTLAALGVAAALDAHPPSHGALAAWGSAEAHHHPFLLHPEGRGWRVDRPRFDADLRAAAVAAGATLHPGLADLARADHGWRLTLRDGRPLDARIVVDATGRRARVARAVGATVLQHDRAVAHVTSWSTPEPDPTSLVEATPWGWWYSAGDAGRVTAFALRDADLPGPADLTRPDPAEAPLTADRLRGGAPGPTSTVAAHHQHLAAALGDGWLAIGDAALAPDPLSSQGLAHALRGAGPAAAAVRALLAGQPAAAWQARHDQLLATHARVRRALHRAEPRWPDAPWWRRRRSEVTLHPLQDLVVTGVRRRALYVAPSVAADLLRRCEAPTPAIQLVRGLLADHPTVLPDALVGAVQDLLARGALRAA